MLPRTLILPIAAALRVAFIAPPASHYVPMLPIAHELLDQGHEVTFLGLADTVATIAKLVPQAHTRALEESVPADVEQKKRGMGVIQELPYSVAQLFTNLVIPLLGNLIAGQMLLSARRALLELKPDVLCVSFIYPSLYALGEALGIPVVGVGWATPSFLTVQNELPWSLEPNCGSIHSREEVYGSLPTLLANFGVRLFSFFTLRLGSIVNSIQRFRIGHPRPLEPWEFDCVLQHPLLLQTLPELTAGSPSLLGPYTFMVGILDHPGLGGNSIAKSDDAARIIEWLDARLAAGQRVLYVAFGSEISPSDPMMRLLAGAFEEASEMHVLWATKARPTLPLPSRVLVTSFAPQRAVLTHGAVFGFLSHGGANSVNEALMLGKPMAIMPFFGDQMAVARAQQELGVGVLVRKDAPSIEIVEAVRRIAGKPFAARSRQVMELNQRRSDMRRAVEVIVNHGSGAFTLHIPPPPAIWLRLVPLLLTLLLVLACCDLFGCVRARPQVRSC